MSLPHTEISVVKLFQLKEVWQKFKKSPYIYIEGHIKP